MVFGFDENVLLLKELNIWIKRQFRAQYYNNPNDLSTSTISKDYFQYYDPKSLPDGMEDGRTKESRP